jgi:hypothetical protein
MYENLASAANALNLFDEACSAFEKLIDLGKNDVDTHLKAASAACAFYFVSFGGFYQLVVIIQPNIDCWM